MNAVLSLCHFCEIHGPRTVYSTQVFRDLRRECLKPDSYNNTSTSKVDEDTWKYGTIERDHSFHDKFSFMMDTCIACQSLPDKKDVIVTNNDDSHISFVSSQFPFQEEIFSQLRQADIRSLSCEVYPEHEDSIYFGDSTRGHVLSFPFNLKDFQARGFQRRYSFLVLMADKMFLLNSWAFFREHLKECILDLQEMAVKVFKKEEEVGFQWKTENPSISEKDRRKRDVGNPRALKDLVGNEEIWVKLHQKFCWILAAGGIRLQEKLVEGTPPLFISRDESCSTSLRDLMKLISPENLKTFFHHLFIGDTIHILSESEEILHNLASILKPVLFDFLHISFGSSRDEHMNEATVFMMQRSIMCDDCADLTIIFTHHGDDTTQSIFDNSSVTVQVIEKRPLNCRPPQIVSKIMSHLLLSPSEFSASLLSLYWATLIDEWTNKLKLWSVLKNSLNESQSTYDSNTNEQTHSLSSNVTRCDAGNLFSRKLLDCSQFFSSKSNISTINNLLNIVGALECDIPMLNARDGQITRFRLLASRGTRHLLPAKPGSTTRVVFPLLTQSLPVIHYPPTHYPLIPATQYLLTTRQSDVTGTNS